MKHIGLLLVLVMTLSAAQAGAAELTETAIRSFVAQQTSAWNRGDLAAYFATFSRDAVFVDQTRTGKGEVIRYGSSPLATARAQSRKLFSTSKVTEIGAVERVILAPDGKSARVLGRAETTIEGKAGRRRVCAATEQRVSLAAGRLVSHGRTDTIRRCPTHR
jgi:hypothetical protein